MFLIGVLLTFVGNSILLPGAWHMRSTWTNLDHGVQVVGGALAGSILLSLVFRRFIPRLPYFNRLILPSSGRAVATLPGPESRGWGLAWQGPTAGLSPARSAGRSVISSRAGSPSSLTATMSAPPRSIAATAMLWRVRRSLCGKWREHS